MKTLFATIVCLMLCGCARNGDQNNRQAESIRQGDLSRPFASEQLPVRDMLPAPESAPALKSESRAEVVSLPEAESVASNNATQQSATGVVNTQIAKLTESLEASFLKFENKLALQNEMSATLQSELKLQASAIANLKAEVKAEIRAEVSALGQAGIGNSSRQESTNVGGNLTTLFSDGMERLMTKMVSVIDSIVLAFVGSFFAGLVSMVTAIVMMQRQSAQLRERDEKRDDANDRLLISLVGVLAKGSEK